MFGMRMLKKGEIRQSVLWESAAHQFSANAPLNWVTSVFCKYKIQNKKYERASSVDTITFANTNVKYDCE